MSKRLKVLVVAILAGILMTAAGLRNVEHGGTLAAGNSGCYTVKGKITETGFFPSFSGTISGDLEGYSETTLDPDIWVTGAVIHNPGERTLSITGGNVPELIGKHLHQTFEGLTVFNTPPVVRINERARVDAGAEKGNFTAHGWLDISSTPLAFEVDYHGVVCP